MEIKTFQYRIKDSTKAKRLVKMAGAVNFVWNYCNEVSNYAIKNHSRWLSYNNLHELTSGSSKELGINSQTIQGILKQYVSSRDQTHRPKLRFRSRVAKSLGWIPFTNQSILIHGSIVQYLGVTFKIWKDRDLSGRVIGGSFNEDSRGRWYVNIQCEVANNDQHGHREVGIDLGCSTQLTCSDSVKYQRENLTRKYAAKMARLQRAGKKKQARNLHAKIKNKRKDWNHKTTTEVCRSSKLVVVGNIKSKQLKQTRLAKSVSDASFYQIKSMLRYKAIRHGVDLRFVNEYGTTITCSNCFARSGPSGLGGLSVREWTCSCGVTHDRDVNAATNILRLGRETPCGSPNWETSSSNGGLPCR